MDENVVERMRLDWNERAKEDAHYYVAFGRHDQDEAEFYATGAEVVKGLEWEMKRLPLGVDRRTRRALEIGCGPGRLMKPMSAHFGEIHGVDISTDMIALAKARLLGVGHAHAHVAVNSDLGAFASESFDLVYSYAVFQHIPSREVVMNYLSEAHRVLRVGGLLRCQINGLPEAAAHYDTWSGVRIAGADVGAFCKAHDLQLLALEGEKTQYMWMTAIKRERGWYAAHGRPLVVPRIRRITNAHSSEPVAPSRGRFACLSLWVEDLAEAADLLDFEVRIGGVCTTIFYIGAAERDGLVQVNVRLPEAVATGMQTVTLGWRGEAWGQAGAVRIIAPPPLVPRIIALSDGVNLMSGTRLVTGSVKVTVEEMTDLEAFTADVDGVAVTGIDHFCTDPVPPRYEVNFQIPEAVTAGAHVLRMRVGERHLGAQVVEVVRGT